MPRAANTASAMPRGGELTGCVLQVSLRARGAGGGGWSRQWTVGSVVLSCASAGVAL